MNSEEGKKNLILRLKKIEGQIRGLQNMIDSNRDCDEIITQLLASIGALKKVYFQILEDYAEKCFLEFGLDYNSDKDRVKEIISKIMDVM